MTESYQFIQIILKELIFNNGKWQGTFDFVYHQKTGEFTGSIPFSYDRTWHLHAFQYPINMDDLDRNALKKAFYEDFVSYSKFIEKSFFEPRDQYAVKPTISSFSLLEEKTTKEVIFAEFSLHNIRETFYIHISLIENEWVYKLSSKKRTIEFYKTYYAWEDTVFDRVSEEISKHPKVRIKYLLHTKKYKNK